MKSASETETGMPEKIWSIVLAVGKPLIRKVPRSVFETKSALWNARDLRTHRATVEPDIPVTVEFMRFDETLQWIETLQIRELLDKRDRQIAVLHGHYWGNAKHEKKIIACIKLCVKRVYIPDFKKILTLPDHVTYFTDIYVHPQFRGKKVGVFLEDCACDFMKAKGFSKQISFNEVWNVGAQRMDEKITRKVTKIRYVRLLGLSFFGNNPVRL